MSRKGCNGDIIAFSALGWNLPLTDNNMMSDASDMLAAALEQMDGIIAGNLHPLKGGVTTLTLRSWLFHYNTFIPFPLAYFHVLAAFRFHIVASWSLFSILHILF